MPEAITLLGVLTSVATHLASELIVFGVIAARKPARRAVESTCERFGTRASGLEDALTTWLKSDDFKSELEALQSGRSSRNDTKHVELFVVKSGLQRGAIDSSAASEILTFFYSELWRELCGSEQGPRLIGARLASVDETVHRILERLPSPAATSASIFAPRPELDNASRASTEEDSQAEIQLDLIRELVNGRRGRAGLVLLRLIESKVEKGIVSAPIRLRFYVNRGACRVICGEFDLASEDFGRAQVLEPNNGKALINLAQIARVRGEHQLVVDLAERVLAQDPREPNAIALKLAGLHELHRYDELDSIVRGNSWIADEPACLYSLSFVAYERGRFDEAEHYARRHAERDGQHAEAWEMLGRSILVPTQQLLREQAASPGLIPGSLRERIEEAEICFSKAAAILEQGDGDRELKFTLSNRGVTRMLLLRFDEARRDFERALELDASLDGVRRNLGALHLNTGSPAKAAEEFSKIQASELRSEAAVMQAAAYLDLGKPEDARHVLGALGPILELGPDSLAAADLMLVAGHRLRDSAACEDLAAELEARRGQEPEVRRILASHELRNGRKEKGLTLMRQAVDLAPESGKARFRLILAEVLYRQGDFAEAAAEYERIPIVPDESPDSERYLAALFNAGRLLKALQVTQSIRGARAAVAHFSEVEALIFERCGDLHAANRLRQHLLDSGISTARQRLKIAANLVRLGQESAASLSVQAVALSEIEDAPELLFEASRLRTILELPDALEFAHRLLAGDFGNPDAHLFYVNTFFRREKIDESLLQPNRVAVHCTAVLRHGNDVQRFTLTSGKGDPAQNRLGVAHPLAVALLGRSAGEKFRFPENTLAEAEYELVQIQSEYVFAFQDCLAHFNERFPDETRMTRVELQPDDPTKILQMAAERERFSEKALSMYRGGSLPACTLAKILGRSNVEVFAGLIADDSTRVFSSSGVSAELKSESGMLRKASSILIETSALVTLASLGLLGAVRKRFETVAVTQQAVDAVMEASRNLHPEKRVGHMFSDSPGHFQFVEQSAEQVQAQKLFYEGIVQFIRDSAEIVAAADDSALLQYEREELRKILGDAAASAVAAASSRGLLMCSDDLPLRRVSGKTTRSVWTQTLLQELRLGDVISADEYHRAVAWLAKTGFHFVSLHRDDLLWVLRANEWRANSEVAQTMGVLAGPECDQDQAVSMALDVLHEIWAEPLPAGNKHMLLDLIIQVLMTGRQPRTVLGLLLKRNQTRSLIWTPSTGEIERAVQVWVAAKQRGL